MPDPTPPPADPRAVPSEVPTPSSAVVALPDPRAAQVARVEAILSFVLRAGVISSLVIVTVGLVVLFFHVPALLTGDFHDALKTMDFPHTITAVIAGLVHFQGRSIIIFGLIVLLATPILRVAISVLIFFHQRDWPFVFITLLVLTLLLISLFSGHGT